MSKVPFILVTGFLGSGKTTLLRELLRAYSDSKRILLIQNEFADSGIDGRELEEDGWQFSLLEMNKGSVFCVCLFSDFKRMITEQIESVRPDLIVLEATGMADPIAVGQLLDDPTVSAQLFLSHIWCIVDAANLLKVKNGIRSIPNQIRIADSIVVNKCDMVEESTLSQIDLYVKEINPYAHVSYTTFCKIDFARALDPFIKLAPIVNRKNIVGELTKCDDRQFTSQTFKTNKPVSAAVLDRFLAELHDGVVRLKGFVRLDDGRSVMVQYVNGDCSKTQMADDQLTTELVAIGTTTVDFEKLTN